MLIAKLKTPIEFILNISPTKTEKRLSDSFYAVPLHYQLGGKDAKFHVFFTEKTLIPKNPASDVQGEQEMVESYPIRKAFTGILNEQELAQWGTNDESLLHIFAKKYEIEIDYFVEYDKQD